MGSEKWLKSYGQNNGYTIFGLFNRFIDILNNTKDKKMTKKK